MPQREQVKEWVRFCKLKGVSVRETTEYVNAHLPNGLFLTDKAIENYITLLNKESKNWIRHMAFDVFQYADELKTRWDNLQELNRFHWDTLMQAREEKDNDTIMKSSMILLKIHEELMQMSSMLPQIAIPKSLELPQPIDTVSIDNGNGNIKPLEAHQEL